MDETGDMKYPPFTTLAYQELFGCPLAKLEFSTTEELSALESVLDYTRISMAFALHNNEGVNEVAVNDIIRV